MSTVPKISYVKSFLKVAEENSFTIAAKKLSTSKTVISRNIQLLEKELGVVLVNRTQQGVSLSAEGKRFSQDAKQIIAQYERLVESIKKRENDMKGDFRIMLPKGLAEMRLLPILSNFSSKYTELHLTLDFSDELKNLSKTGFDVAIRSGSLTSEDQDFIAQSISNDVVILCASKKYVDTLGHPIYQVSDLQDCDLIKDTNLKNTTLETFFEQNNLGYNTKIEANSAWFIKHALLSHMGVALIPSKFIEEELKNGELVRLLPSQDFGSRGLWVVYLKEYRKSKKIKSLISTLRCYL